MASYKTQRILPIILTIVVIIVAIAGLVALARLLFAGSSSSTTKVTDTTIAQQQLLTTSEGRSVSMTVRGPIVADEDFRSYRIVISPNSRTFEAFTGYLTTVTDRQKLSNNTAAYDQFVHALDKANMVSGRELEGDKNNVLGICATGKVYEFAVLSGGEMQHMFWTSTCKGSPGSLRGSAAQLSALFLAQLPDSAAIASDLKL